MLILIAILLTMVPAAFILWPFVFGPSRNEFEYEEGSEHADLMMRWDAAAAGLAGAELEHTLGNLSTHRLPGRQPAASVRGRLDNGRDGAFGRRRGADAVGAP